MQLKKCSFTVALSLLAIAMAHADQAISIKNDAQLNELFKTKKMVVAKFEAPWCGPCQNSKKPFAEVAADSKATDVSFVIVDIDKNDAIAKKFNVASIPTVVYFVDGKEMDRDTGLVSVADFKQNLRNKLTQHAGAPAVQEAQATATEAEESMPAAAPQVAYEPSFFGNIIGVITGIFDSILGLIKGIVDWFLSKLRGIF